MIFFFLYVVCFIFKCKFENFFVVFVNLKKKIIYCLMFVNVLYGRFYCIVLYRNVLVNFNMIFVEYGNIYFELLDN